MLNIVYEFRLNCKVEEILAGELVYELVEKDS